MSAAAVALRNRRKQQDQQGCPPRGRVPFVVPQVGESLCGGTATRLNLTYINLAARSLLYLRTCPALDKGLRIYNATKVGMKMLFSIFAKTNSKLVSIFAKFSLPNFHESFACFIFANISKTVFAKILFSFANYLSYFCENLISLQP